MKSNARGVALLGVMALGTAWTDIASAQAGANYPQPMRGARTPAATSALLPAQDGAPPASEGPQGSSQRAPGEERYDEIGYAGIRPVGGNGGASETAVVAVSGTLPADTVVEVTSLETGKTALVLITAQMPVPPGRLLDLSPGAARQLGGGAGTIPVRVRKLLAAPQDHAALRQGQPAAERLDAPPALLAGLRKRLGAPPREATGPAVPSNDTGQPAPTRTPPRAAPAASPRPILRRGGFYVQIAALSNGTRAQTLANSLSGVVRSGGGLYRVQVGPYADAATAERSRAALAGRGYPDARVVSGN